MKKIFAILLVLAMMISVVACGANDDKNNDANNDANNNVNNNVNNENNESGNDSENADSGNDSENADSGETVELAYKNALEVLTTIWNSYADEEKFSVGGGDYENMVMDAPGSFNLTGEESADSLSSMTHFPTEHFAKIDDAATMFHGMVANNFTVGAYHFTSADDMNGIVDVLKDTLKNTHWMCGFPESAVIISVPGDYLVVVYGLNDAVNPFVTNTLAAIDGAEVVGEQDLAF